MAFDGSFIRDVRCEISNCSKIWNYIKSYSYPPYLYFELKVLFRDIIIDYGIYLAIYEKLYNFNYIYKLCDKEYDKYMYNVMYPKDFIIKIKIRKSKSEYARPIDKLKCNNLEIFPIDFKGTEEMSPAYVYHKEKFECFFRSVDKLCHLSKGKIKCLRLNRINMSTTFKVTILPCGNYSDIIKILTQQSKSGDGVSCHNLEHYIEQKIMYFECLPNELIELILTLLLNLY